MADPEAQPARQPSARRPTLEVLDPPLVQRIVAEALDVLGEVGVFVESDDALALLADAGARVDPATRRAFLPDELVWRSVRSAPSAVSIFSRDGQPALRLQELNVHFNPGSAAIRILDADTGQARAPVTSDVVALARLADALPHLDAQSTALVPADVPETIADRYRLLLVLLNSSKPVVTGTFTREGLAVMREMLVAVAGSERALRERPMAIFDVCPSSPLRWSSLEAESLVALARWGIPAEIVPAPLLGATAPLSLAGALVEHTAENLSGVVLHQLAAAGSPLIYGGSPAVFDMRYGTAAVASVESALVACAYAQIGRFLGLPTHGYLGLSDAKLVDAQAGLESATGAVLAALAGLNVVSGAGMLEFESCQSLEKLAIDDEICGMARRLVQGIQPRGEPLAEDLRGELAGGGHFLTSPATLQWLRSEIAFPSPLIDRLPRQTWQAEGSQPITARARQRVRALLAQHQPKPLADEVRRRLLDIVSHDAAQHGLARLPVIPGP